MRDYKELRVWKHAHQLTLDVYRVTKSFPAEERYGLTSQLRRATSSIPTNIAEGSGRGSNADFCRFLWIAMGSAAETDYELVLARDLGYLSPDDYDTFAEALASIKRMLNAFIQHLSNG